MANARDLESQARHFAEQMQDLLNRTVCDYVQFGAVVAPGGVTAGTMVTRKDFQSKPVPLRSATHIPLWLDAHFWLMLDEDEQRFLTVTNSMFGIRVGPSDQLEDVLHYDFERDKDKAEEKYPEAHIQVHGRHTAFEAYAAELGVKNRLGRYHLPVGGRRLRPCLEDVIEFLITERLVEPHDGWQLILDQSRKEYRRKQIAALVRKHHLTAIAELERIGYKVEKPKDPKFVALAKSLLGLIPKVPDKRIKKAATKRVR